MAFNNSSQVPPGLYCGPCGCPPPPGIENLPPPPGSYAKADEQISKIVPPILLTIGTVGNCLTIVIILRQWRKLTSTSIFLLALALSDLVILYTGLLRQWIKVRWSFDVRFHSEIGCKFSVFFTYSSIQISSWILVAVTVERVASVVWPMKVKYGCRPKFSIIALLVIIVAIFGLNSHFFYGYGQSELPQYEYGPPILCEPLYQHYFDFIHDIWYWIDFVVPFALPFVILTTGNTVIIYKLYKTRSKVRKMSIIKSKGSKTFNKESKTTTVVLILLCVMFLICMSPASIYFVYLPYRMEKIEREMCNDLLEFFRQVEITRFLQTVTNMMIFVNASFNFLMYVISGHRFRDELKSMLCCGKKTNASVFGTSSSGDSKRRNYTNGGTETSIVPERQSNSVDQSNVDETPEANADELSSKL